MRRGAKYGAPRHADGKSPAFSADHGNVDKMFLEPEKRSEQELVDAILDAIVYEEKERESLRRDPLIRFLIPNAPGNYNFKVVTAMGVITEGKAGLELQAALDRLREKRGVRTIRADTATARSFEYNAGKIIEAIESAKQLHKPFGLIGYSQGCANALYAESLMVSGKKYEADPLLVLGRCQQPTHILLCLSTGTPVQQHEISSGHTGLVCRQLLFSAANGSRHGPATDKKAQRLIVMVEDFLKYQQGYFSKALQSIFLEAVTSVMDSAQFQKIMGGAETFTSDGVRVFWREAQHLPHVPTCTLRGVLEEHTTPECLEMLSNMLTKQSGSELHDSQVHVFDAIGHPVYHNNRNGKVLEKCYVGKGAIQRTHHWSPLSDEVEFVKTARDDDLASFDCAKDRHVFPWVDVNVRFGFIKYAESDESQQKVESEVAEWHRLTL